MEDYTDDSVLFTPDATVRGLGELRSFFTEFVKLLTPDFLANFKMEKQKGEGNTPPKKNKKKGEKCVEVLKKKKKKKKKK
ncbi:MAG: hypothetical protein QF714_12790 [Dehalococcoidia bacterium]|nr:hypothetical protein [Dehalococcoidia bacterium]